MIRSILVSTLAICSVANAESKFIQAELMSSIKMKKAKVGDVVKARVSTETILANGITIPADSTLVGQLRTVEPNSLAISFDALESKGKSTPLHLSVRAAMMPTADGTLGGRSSQREVGTTGAVIGLNGVTLQVDESATHASRFEATKGELKLDKGLQLMLTVVE